MATFLSLPASVCAFVFKPALFDCCSIRKVFFFTKVYIFSFFKTLIHRVSQHIPLILTAGPVEAVVTYGHTSLQHHSAQLAKLNKNNLLLLQINATPFPLSPFYPFAATSSSSTPLSNATNSLLSAPCQWLLSRTMWHSSMLLTDDHLCFNFLIKKNQI